MKIEYWNALVYIFTFIAVGYGLVAFLKFFYSEFGAWRYPYPYGYLTVPLLILALTSGILGIICNAKSNVERKKGKT